MPFFILPTVALAMVVLFTTAAGADLTTQRTAWTNFTPMNPQTIGGIPVRDYEGGSTEDPSNGGASFGAENDIASGGPPYAETNCNPDFDGATTGTYTDCGTATSAFWSRYDGGTVWDGVLGSASMCDDYVFLRMRVDGCPLEGSCGATETRLNNNHWNFLISVAATDPGGVNDGFKEFWVDLFGNDDEVVILYEDNNSQQISGRTDCNTVNDPTFCSIVNRFRGCGQESAGDASCPLTNPTSHSRATSIAGSDGSPGAALEWYLDVQVPICALTDTGADSVGATYETCANTNTAPRPTCLVTPNSQLAFFFSTGDSSTNPLQKDFIATCVNPPNGSCNFGNTTPVTLSYFHAGRDGAGARVEWSTATETGNVGFNVYGKIGGRWVQLNRRLVASKKLDSLARQDYSFEVASGFDVEEFAIEDVNVLGHKRRHDGFAMDETYGERREATPIDWQSIRAESQSKAEARERGQRSAIRRLTASAGHGGGGAPAPVYPTYDLRVTSDGLHRVTYEQLLAAGLNLNGVAANSLALRNLGSPVAIRVVGAGGGNTFGPGGFVEFYGVAADTQYTGTNVYRLSVDPAAALRATVDKTKVPTQAPSASYTATLSVENDAAWSFGSPNGDPWYESQMLAFTTPVVRNFPLVADFVAAGSPATLKVGMWGATDWPTGPDHHVRVALNGVDLGESFFDGINASEPVFNLPAGLLVAGANTVTLTLPGDLGFAYDVVFLDRFVATYPRAFQAQGGQLTFASSGQAFQVQGLPSSDVVAYERDGSRLSFLSAVQVTGGGGSWSAKFRGSNKGATYYVASGSSLKTPGIGATPTTASLDSGPAQYLVITHPDFAGGLGSLVAARQAQGLAVKVVDVQAIYAQYGYGLFDPQAIKSYVAYAAANLGTQYVLLVGGDTFDYRNRLGSGSVSFIPTLYAPTHPIVRFSPADSLFADVDGDDVPDLAIGRLPVRTSAELSAVIGKTLAYPSAGHARTAVFAADGSALGGDFSSASDYSIGALPPSWDVERAYIDTLGTDGARTQLIDSINAGVALTQFIGHSDTDFWSFDNLFNSTDAAALTNSGRPSVVVQWGCWNSFYVSPAASTLADSLLQQAPDRGAAAVIGPAALSEAESDTFLSRLLLERLALPGTTLGAALRDAKQALDATHPDVRDVVIGVNLLGDPALVVEP
jgi:peptidase C25-like protein